MSSLERIDEDAEKDEAGRFVEMFSQLRRLLETKNEVLTGWGKQTFAVR